MLFQLPRENVFPELKISDVIIDCHLKHTKKAFKKLIDIPDCERIFSTTSQVQYPKQGSNSEKNLSVSAKKLVIKHHGKEKKSLWTTRYTRYSDETKE